MQNQKVIERLGYSSNEAKVYLTSLTLGEAHISDIAKKLDMPRSTVQEIAERLHEEGLMSFYVIRRYKYWVAADPQQLLLKLKERENMVEEAIPKLVALKKTARKHAQNLTQLDDLNPLKQVADGMHQPVLITNHNAEILYINDAWKAQFGHSLEALEGKHTRVLKSGKTHRTEYDRLWQTLRAGKLFTSTAIFNQTKDKTDITCLTVIFPVMYGNRKFYVQILENLNNQNSDLKNFATDFNQSLKT